MWCRPYPGWHAYKPVEVLFAMRKYLGRRLVALIIAVVVGRIVFALFPSLLERAHIENAIVLVLLFSSYQWAAKASLAKAAVIDAGWRLTHGGIVGFGLVLVSISFIVPIWLQGGRPYLFTELHTVRWGELAAWAIVVAVIEEVGLRGYLQDFLSALRVPIIAVVLLQALLFAWRHTNNFTRSIEDTLFFCLAGAMFSVAVFYYKSLYWAIGMHFAWDFANYLLWGMRRTGAAGHFALTPPFYFGVGYSNAAVSVVLLCMTIYFFNKILRQTSNKSPQALV
jgi:membrane protease YdiL (CAAX protease family)